MSARTCCFGLTLVCLAALSACSSAPQTAALPTAPVVLSQPQPRISAPTQHALRGQLQGGPLDRSQPVQIDLAILMLDQRGRPVATLDSEQWFGNPYSPFQLALDPSRLPPGVRLQLRARVSHDSQLLAFAHHDISQPLPAQLPILTLQAMP
ncbi:hypothetical protein [Atopomonas sediminilitoris]|uniref:hypothetical protein n=1 Tax=Atopomonas sediminilitoris TaxID=2919919 RepID=UPI001F4E7E1C|nr:hypothetical protein [Atopomonas sediminilitoris]MCJ8168460.1 hypothetical protein [Atopomonas sediminilitoris]